MKMRRVGIQVLIFASCICCLFIWGCGGDADVLLKRYQPKFNSDLSMYKGKKIYLMNFDNQAKNTTLWYYRSTDKKITYGYGENSLIHNYFWYSFQDAFLSIGVGVSNVDNPDPTAPAMWLTLLSITDEEFQVRVTLQQQGSTILSEPFSLKEPVPANKDIAALEKRTYEMTNKLFVKILTNPDFQKSFFKASQENK